MQVINDTMGFNDYWKEKSTKRKKSWAGKFKRFAQKHMQLEAIRSEIVYGRIKREEVRSLLDEHRIVQNPIARWDSDMHFSFSEHGLSEAMQAEGADVSSLMMTISKKNIVGQQPHEITYGDILDLADNRRDLYKKYTDLETCTINYREVTMVICRYTYLQQPFAMYELVPCKQLSISDLRLEETSFSTLNIATLLMEMAAEWELRKEEFNYYAKKLKLRTMEAVLVDSIEFELWNEKKLQKKISEYITKDYNLDKIVEQVFRPWKSAVKKFIDAALERSLRDQTETLEKFSFRHSCSDRFVEECLRPYLESVGLQEVALVIPGKDHPDVILKYQGRQLRLSSYYSSSYHNDIFFYPNSYYDGCLLDLAKNTPLSTIGDYLKLMPTANQRVDETILKVLHIYDQQMQQNEKYHAAVEQLEALAQEYAGKPVGKMMKYLRWEAGRLINGGYRIPLIPTIKVVSDNAFSFVEEKRFGGIVSQEEVMGWVDADCHNVYASDPSAPDPEDKRLPFRTVQEFIRQYGLFDPEPILAIDFIEQKL